MANKMELTERIDEVTANSVTPEEFKETWGYSIDEHVEDMMNRIHQLEATEASANARRKAPASVERRVAARKVVKDRLLQDSDFDSEAMKEVAAKILEMAEKLSAMGGIIIKERKEGGKTKGRRMVIKKDDISHWALKLVAVPTGSGKTITTHAPETGFIEFKDLKGATLESVKGLMVDVGGLKIPSEKGPKRPGGIKGPKL